MANYLFTPSGSDSTGDGSTGNPWASPGYAASQVTTPGDMIWGLAPATYTLSTGTPGPGGPVVLASGVGIQGFFATFGDLGARPVIHAGSVTAVTLVTLTQSGLFNNPNCSCINVEFDGNNGSGVNGINIGSVYSPTIAYNIARNCQSGFLSSGAFYIANCAAISCGNGFSEIYSVKSCWASNCSSNGFYKGRFHNHCISVGNGANGFYEGDGYPAVYDFCTAYGNSADGFEFDYDIASVTNCISYGNTGYGFNNAGSGRNPTYINNAGTVNNPGPNQINQITLSADPFTYAAGQDFSLNNVTGGGAACYINLQFPGNGLIYKQAIGAIPWQASGSSGGLLFPRHMLGGLQ